MAAQDFSFDQAMFEVYKKAKEEAGYNAVVFLQMLTETGGLTAARTLLNASKPSDGYTALYMRGRLDLTVEAVVTENAQWTALFTANEIARAKRRLLEYQYKPKNWSAL